MKFKTFSLVIGSRRKCDDKGNCNSYESINVPSQFTKLMLGEGPCSSDTDCDENFICSTKACLEDRLTYSDYSNMTVEVTKCCGVATYANIKAVAFIPTTYESCKKHFF